MIGQTISHYQITRELGRGGMGVVYLADDLRLGRQVAIKALPSDLSRDPIRRKRFEQEARACAALHHGSIAAVFDLEEAGDELFIIFEYVDGEDLRALLQRGLVPTAQLMKLAQGIGRGLAAAHQAGIIHRDLKPENIRVNSAGEIKILDFGLARMQPELLSAAATFSFAVTQQGSIVGTVGYMSPEQLESRELDARSDIFSLGVILYEMAAGVHPFQGESPASTIANVLTKDPAPVEHLNPVQPPALDRIIRKCLAKKKEQRYQSVGDLLLDFEDVQRKSDDTMKTAVMRPDTALLETKDSESLLAAVFARFIPNMRRWWEMHHLFMTVAVPAMFPYLAWQMRGSQGSQLDLLFFFTVVFFTVINFVFRMGMLLSAAFDPAKRAETLQRMGPGVRITHIILCLAVVFFTPKFVTEHPLLGTFFAALVVGGILVSIFIEPWIERGAFPELARLRDELKAKDNLQPNKGPRQWWLIHHVGSMFVWTPMMVLLPWLIRDWLPQENNLANAIVFLCIVLAIQNFGFRAYLIEVAWFHREGLEATVRKMATPILLCNLLLVALCATISLLLFQAHTAPAAGFLVMAVSAAMIVGLLEPALNGYAFPVLRQQTAFRVDDLTRLGLMQLAYFASSAYLMAVAFLALEISWFAEIKAKVAIVTWLHRSTELFMGGTSMITVIVSPVMAWWLLVQRKREVVTTFRNLFIFVAILYFGATGGAFLFTLRYLSIPAGLVLLTGMLYGIWYQWILASRISPASSRYSFRFDDLTRLGLTQLAYLAASAYLLTSLSAAVSTGRGWLSLEATIDIGAWVDYFVGTSSMVTVAVSSVMAWALLVQRNRDAVAPFRQLFILVAVLYLGITGGVALLTLRYLSLPVGLVLFTGMLYGIWYQWILASRISPVRSPSAFRFDDLTRLAAIQLLYIAPNIYMLASLLRQLDQVPQWLSQTPIPNDLYALVSFTLACTIAVLFQGSLAWGLLQRRRDVVVSFRRWFVLFVFLAFISMQGAMLGLARHTNLFVLLIGATALLYGIRYQWLLAKRILAADKDTGAQSASVG